MEAEERQFDFFHFLALVPELQLLVVSHLDVEDLPSLSLVSKHFYSLTQENVLWKSMVDRKWPGATKIAGHPATRRHYTGLDKVKWHEYYIERTSFERPGSLKWVHHPTKSSHDGAGEHVEPQRLNEIYSYDTESTVWSLITPRQGTPPNFARHTAESVGKKIVVYGGYDGISKFFDVAVFDTENFTWTQPQVSGDVPLSRSNHASAVVGHKLYIHGGMQHAGNPKGNIKGLPCITLDDFYELNTLTWVWRKLDRKGVAPTERIGHRMQANGKRLFLFGGGVWSFKNSKWGENEHEFWIYDTEEEEWTKPATWGDIPHLCYPFMFTLGSYVFATGGQTTAPVVLSPKFYVLDTISLEWRALTDDMIANKSKFIRDMGTATIVHHKRDPNLISVIFYGGYCTGAVPPSEDFYELQMYNMRFCCYP